MLLPIYPFLSPLHIANLVIEQTLGQDLCFREKFDVAVARAVAEMRILGNLENPDLSFFSMCLWDIQVVHFLWSHSYWFFIFSWILSSTCPCWWIICSCKGSWSSGMYLPSLMEVQLCDHFLHWTLILMEIVGRSKKVYMRWPKGPLSLIVKAIWHCWDLSKKNKNDIVGSFRKVSTQLVVS